MSHDEHHEDLAYDPAAAHRSRRRKRAAVGVVGLAALLGGGAFLITEQLTDGGTVIDDSGALAPLTPATSPSAKASSSAPATSRAPAGTVSRRPTSAPAEKPTSARERVQAAREAAAKNGVEVQRPLPVAPAQALSDVQVTNSGSLKEDGRTLRVVSARGDLTGYRELAWVTGAEKVGDASCTQTFKFADNATAERKPNLLICWRTSSTASAYTVMVDLDGKPSKQDSVAALAKQWSRLG
jgi:hypothetical protein